jgi:hypothetical protein
MYNSMMKDEKKKRKNSASITAVQGPERDVL